jgi:hypothetical protein
MTRRETAKKNRKQMQKKTIREQQKSGIYKKKT